MGKKRMNRPREQLQGIYAWLTAHPKGHQTQEQWAAAASQGTNTTVDKGLIARFMERNKTHHLKAVRVKRGSNRIVAPRGEVPQIDNDKEVLRLALRALVAIVEKF